MLTQEDKKVISTLDLDQLVFQPHITQVIQSTRTRVTVSKVLIYCFAPFLICLVIFDALFLGDTSTYSSIFSSLEFTTALILVFTFFYHNACHDQLFEQYQQSRLDGQRVTDNLNSICRSNPGITTRIYDLLSESGRDVSLFSVLSDYTGYGFTIYQDSPIRPELVAFYFFREAKRLIEADS